MGTKDTITLDIDARSARKKKVRSLRREGIIPGVIYGKGIESIPVQVNEKDFERVYKKSHGTAIIDAAVGGKTIHLLIHEIQRDTLSQDINHIDFLKVDLRRDVTVDIPLVFVGESSVEKEGRGKIGQETTSISIKCSPKNIPSEIEVDISTLQDKHDVIHASDLKLPEGSTLAHGVSEDKVIATVVPAKFVEAAGEEEALEEGEAAEAGEAPASTEE
ncbi:MAG TPA: 50S ribosomal protein L25 [Deltaproteobacteria bacterium]|nr:50S ribosomal protein L25 [Deltaproteobacteria bacterium]